jgi:uncharacterized DUF497 family protein
MPVFTILYIHMRVEWDRRKNEVNRTKHGIDFETARLVFEDPQCVTFVERVTEGEERWHAIGSIEEIVILVVVHTYRAEGSDEVIRIFSARAATRRERKLYVEANR